MKKLILASILAVGLGSAFVYANQAALELEHANRLATGDDSVQQDMGNMKAQGKCNTDQTDKRKTKIKVHNPSVDELEIEYNEIRTIAEYDDGF
jgi:hypothetical protein